MSGHFRIAGGGKRRAGGRKGGRGRIKQNREGSTLEQLHHSRSQAGNQNLQGSPEAWAVRSRGLLGQMTGTRPMLPWNPSKAGEICEEQCWSKGVGELA